MNGKDYLFELHSYDINALIPQAGRALEKRTELVSRKRLPGLWRVTDACRAASGGKTQSTLRTRVTSIALLALGAFLVVSGLSSSGEPSISMIIGAVSAVSGIGGLYRTSRLASKRFEKSAGLLLKGKDSMPANPPITVTFSEAGMTISSGGTDGDCVPYDRFECAVETADLLLLVYSGSAALLQKSDLMSGDIKEFCAFLAENIWPYEVIES